MPEADGRPEAASSGALLAEENGGAPDDQGTAFCSAAAMPPSGNPYDGECQSKSVFIHVSRLDVARRMVAIRLQILIRAVSL